jgi:hypothetical protein
MKMDLTRACADCPFRRDNGIRIRADRIREITNGMLKEGGNMTFMCHRTTSLPKKDRQHCAGALIFALKHRRETQVMQLARRLNYYDPTALRGRRAIFDTVEEFLLASD